MKPLVLITDGNAELCKLYRHFLTKRGYQVETSSDGLDCLAKLRQVKPAVLVLDQELRWGGSDGVLACLREESPTPWVPVVLTATNTSSQLLSELVEPPVVHCLRKPFSLTALLDSIRSAAVLRIDRKFRGRESPRDNALADASQAAR